MGATPCLRSVRDGGAGAPTLVLLPHAGGSARSFAGWAATFPGASSLVAAEYPGRGRRAREPLAPELVALADEIAAEIAAELGRVTRPLYLFGHSMGAMIGFEVAWRLETTGRPVAGLIASAATPPHRRREAPVRVADLDDAQLLALLASADVVPPRLARRPGLFAGALRTCRADLKLATAYDYGSGHRRLRAPIMALGGDTDELVDRADLADWQELTLRPEPPRTFPGGHFYHLGGRGPDVQAFVAAYLERAAVRHGVATA